MLHFPSLLPLSFQLPVHATEENAAALARVGSDTSHGAAPLPLKLTPWWRRNTHQLSPHISQPPISLPLTSSA